MALSNFTPDESGIAEILVSPEVGAMLLAVMQEGQAFAEAASADFVVSGEYASSFHTSVGVEVLPKGRAHPAQVATLVNEASYSVAVEYGYGGRSGAPTKSAHGVLRRTLGTLHL